eukprot:m.127937 g.127937  ORF g.127937 m.127937 type:complete len:57 (+) comp37939_c0_seq11:721-891(+)
MSWPDWLTDEDYDQLVEVSNYAMFKRFDGRDIQRLTSGKETLLLLPLTNRDRSACW